MTEGEVEEFVRTHWDLAVRSAAVRARRAGWRGDPAEVQSDAILGLLLAARSWDPSSGSSAEGWVRYRVRNAVADGLRARHGDIRRRGKATLYSATRSLVQDGANPNEDPPDPGDAHGDVVTALAVAQVLAAVDGPDREMLTSYYLDGRTLADIGAEHGVTESAVSHRLSAARARARAVALRTNERPRSSPS